MTLDQVRADLPDWPDDVTLHWLVPLASRPGYGWPPPEPLGRHQWYYTLSRRPLSWWRDVRWKLENIPFDLSTLSGRDRGMAVDMFDAYFRGASNGYSNMMDGAARTKSVVQYLAKHGVFPRPVIAMRIDGLRVVDGSHRVLALLYCQRNPDHASAAGAVALSSLQPVWIGDHLSGQFLQ